MCTVKVSFQNPSILGHINLQVLIKAFLRSVIVDGVTLGHPCCGVHDCTIPLDSNRARFCAEHYEKSLECVVTDCNALAEKDHQTCTIPEHRAREEYVALEGKSMFSLKQRHLCLRRKRPDKNFLTDDAPEVDEEEPTQDAPECGKSDDKALKARFGRRWTYCEELCVASCGVILGRATMYGSEGVNGVRVRG